jgi:predicted CXXCH cytochrome family protein
VQRNFKVLLTAGALMTVIVGGTWLYAAGVTSAQHPVDEPCASCHLYGNNTTAANASKLIASQEQLCGHCHANALTMSHPSGFTPASDRKAIPAVYPLDWKGDLTCSTCHQVHSDLPGKLRGAARGPALCLSCHDQKFFDAMVDGGESMVLSGHLGIQNSASWQNLDPYSVQCMDCHVSRGDVMVDTSMIARHGSQNHPVGRKYSEAAKFGGLKPELQVSRKIPLPNGMVSCVSCHETYTRNHGKVLTSGNTTTLCFECHDI